MYRDPRDCGVSTAGLYKVQSYLKVSLQPSEIGPTSTDM